MPTTPPAPRSLLVGWDLRAHKVLVVGGGRIGEAKVETLLQTGAKLTVVAPEVTERLADLADRGRLTWVARRFRPFDARGCALVVAAVSDDGVNQRARRWAKRFGALVNVVDDPASCDVIMPAVLDRGTVRLAISTDGATPAGARFLREQLDEVLPPCLDELFLEAASARVALRSSGRYRYDYPAWRQRFFEPGWEALSSGNAAGLRELRMRFLATFEAPTPIRLGKVTLVGAGPGGADLITVRGAAALASADVVVYDRLVDPELLGLAPSVAERIPVGKAKGHGTEQAAINQILVDRALAGAHVVRLKGGDPFVFGRGGEEVEAVRRAGIEADVIPGLSSALAGPALAGIPVTHRGVAAAVTIVTGHRIAEADEPEWTAFAASGATLVVLMGASTARAVAARLLEGGRPLTEPVAAVHRAGSADGEVARLTLGELATIGSPFPSPTVLVIGAVASLANDAVELAASLPIASLA